MRIVKYILIIALIFIFAFYVRHLNSPYQIFKGQIFGTYYVIKINSKSQINNLGQKIKDRLATVNKQMSVFDTASEISKINQSEANKKIKLSPAMSYLMQTAHVVWQQSNGWFDPTVGELVELWGFGTKDTNKEPSSEQIRESLNYSNFGKLSFDNDFNTLNKKDSRTYINLSAIAKGYGVDQVAKLLEENGIKDYLIEIGGEVRVAGQSKHGGWTIGITSPKNKDESVMQLEMTDYSVATSGNYRNYYYRDGKKYTHTISPKTGYPTENSIASVSVFHPQCILADAYATAILAMGEKEAKIFVKKQNLAVILQLQNEEIYISPAAKQLIGE